MEVQIHQSSGTVRVTAGINNLGNYVRYESEYLRIDKEKRNIGMVEEIIHLFEYVYIKMFMIKTFLLPYYNVLHLGCIISYYDNRLTVKIILFVFYSLNPNLFQ